MFDLPSRYEDRRLLGEGGMGQVRLVFDRERDEEVAFKTLAPAEGADEQEARFLFKQEFWAMASLRHPHLVAAYDYGELADGKPYITMELVGGSDLAIDRVAGEDEVRAWLPGIAGALGYLHGQGYVHADVKPENVRVGAVPKLMDLGLLTRAGRGGNPIRGSLQYLAPEVARQAPLDGRADLYSLGAVLYHALAGRAPFEGGSAIALLRAHLDETPAPLRSLNPEVSRELESAVMKLLAKEPAARFASAAELLEALGLRHESEEGAVLLGSPLLGRDDVQGELLALIQGEGGGTRWVLGGAGSGKSRLLTEARANAQLAGLPAFFAQGLGAESSPYLALRPWLLALASRPSGLRARLAPVLARLLPELAQLWGLPGLEPAPALEGPQERLRLHGAIAELARDVAPSAVWLLDDADQLDAASRELLSFLQGQAQRDKLAWRWLLSAQAAGEGTRQLPLAPLDEATTLAMARAVLGQQELPAGLAERLPLLTGGLPGAIEAVLGHWVRHGALVREGGRWVAPAADKLELPGGWQVALDARFSELGAEAQVVGRTAALLGVQADLPWLQALVGLDGAAFFRALAELEAAEVLAREDSHFRFLRPAQAAALAASWEPAERRRQHTAAARWLTARLDAPADSPALPMAEVRAAAHHHLAGETPLEGIPYVLAAARRSLAIFVAAGLDTLLERALAVEGLAPAQRAELQMELGTVMRFNGRIDDALSLYEEQLLPTLRELQLPQLAHELVTLGVIYQMKGRYPDALAALAEGINMADEQGDVDTGLRARTFAGRVALFAGQTGAARTHLASAARRAREHGATQHLAAALGLYGYLLATSEPVQLQDGLDALDESIQLNRELDNLYELYEALNNQGNVYMATGRLREARATFEECLALCLRIGMANEALFGQLNLGAVLLELGQVTAALPQARKAVEMAKQQGRKFPEGFALALEGLLLVHGGEAAKGMERLERGLSLAREIKNRYLELNVLTLMAEATLVLGRFEASEGHLLKARDVADATHNDEQNAKLERLTAALAVATDAPDAEARMAKLIAAGLAGGQPAPQAHALRWQADRMLRAGKATPALGLATEAAVLAEQAGLVALGAEIAELRGRAAMETDRATALLHFRHGRTLAAEAGVPLTEALCLAGIGACDPAEREARQEAPRRLEALLTGLEPAEREAFLAYPEREAALHAAVGDGGTYSADRLHHLTDLIAMISVQPDLQAVMAQALAALVDVAGADRGFLLLYKGFEVTQQIFHGMDESESDAYSSGLAYQILWSGEPMFVQDAQAHEDFASRASIQALSLRSMVGVPLNDGNETLGVMLADSRSINSDFRPEDLDLCMALARQVAIAITNTRRLQQYKNGYEELQVLHRLALATLGLTDLAAFTAALGAEAIQACDGDRLVLLLGPELAVSAGVDAHGRLLTGDVADISQSVSRWVYEQGEPLHLLDAQADESFQNRKSIQALGLRTIYAVPVVHEGRRLGVLYLDNTRMADADPQGLHTLARLGEMAGAFVSRLP